MRIILHAGLEYRSAQYIQHALAEKRGGLLKNGFMYPKDDGLLGPNPLFISVLRNQHADPTRTEFGFATADRLETLREQTQAALTTAIYQNTPQTLIISLPLAASRLSSVEDVQALHSFFQEFSDDVQVVLFLPPPDQALVHNVSWQFTFGRTTDFSAEAAVRAGRDYYATALKNRQSDVGQQRFAALTEAAAFPDYDGLANLYGSVFGADKLRLLPWLTSTPSPDDVRVLCRDAFDLPGKFGRPSDHTPPTTDITLETLSRLREVNAHLAEIEAKQGVLPQRLRRRMASDLSVPGQRLTPAHLASLVPRPQVIAGLDPCPPRDVPDLAYDATFDAAGFLSAYRSEIQTSAHLVQRRESDLAKERKARRSAQRNNRTVTLSEAGARFLDTKARGVLKSLAGSPFLPRTGTIVRFDEAQTWPDIPPRARAEPTGTLLVGCMKNEGPYILEWIAYHLGIGVDKFLIYSNNCQDGTDRILDRLQDLGVLRHIRNDKWRGRSPQQAALNNAVTQTEYKTARWVMHIDIDEFVNIRMGTKGTLDEVYDKMGHATNLAMTWRLFGHNAITEFQDAPILGQFTQCAPDWCPKPHTAWGFKTLFRNSGAYTRLSCHRPKGLSGDGAESVRWVNGSLRHMGTDVKARGWRSNQRTVGYDAVQLNHYAVRSAESFLIKRQRGRALHVDRTIGVNYWTRMDWNSQSERSIQRHLPRTRRIMQGLRQDTMLDGLHQETVAWHYNAARSLRCDPDFEALFHQIVELDLTDMERVAATLASDMQS